MSKHIYGIHKQSTLRLFWCQWLFISYARHSLRSCWKLKHPGRHPGSFSKLLSSDWNRNLRNTWRTGVRLADCNTKKCLSFPHCLSCYSPRPPFNPLRITFSLFWWEHYCSPLKSITLLFKVKLQCNHSGFLQLAKPIRTWKLHLIKGVSQWTCFHGTVPLRLIITAFLIILSFPHDMTYIGMVFDISTEEKLIPKIECGRDLLLPELHAITPSDEMVFLPPNSFFSSTKKFIVKLCYKTLCSYWSHFAYPSYCKDTKS